MAFCVSLSHVLGDDHGMISYMVDFPWAGKLDEALKL